MEKTFKGNVYIAEYLEKNLEPKDRELVEKLTLTVKEELGYQKLMKAIRGK